MLSPQRLRIFREVVTQGSFSDAAAALAYSQPAVSQAVSALEAETGVALLERDRRGVRVTPAGETLVEHADAILARIEAAEAEMAAIAGVRGGRLRMATFPTAGATLVPLAVARFRTAHPDVELSLVEDEPDALVPRLRTGEVDVALVYDFPGDSREPVTGLRRTPLFDDPMDVALPAGHPLAERKELELSDLRDEAWIQTSAASPCARHVVRSCHRAGFDPIVSFESDDYGTVQGLVAAGVGVALVPRLAGSARPDVVVRALHPSSPVRRVLVATPRGAGVTPAARAMVAVLGDVSGHYVEAS